MINQYGGESGQAQGAWGAGPQQGLLTRKRVGKAAEKGETVTDFQLVAGILDEARSSCFSSARDSIGGSRMIK
jgi:hypothetical protein